MVLYDFIYLDTDRINSYYAQIFEGLLKDVSNKTSASETENEKVVGGIKPFFNGELEGGKTYTKEEVKTVDPKDIVIIDTLSNLNKNSKEINKAKPNDIINAKGNLYITTNSILGMFVDLMSDNIFDTSSRKTKQEKREINQLKKMMKSFVSNISIDPLLLLKSDTKDIIVGSLKENYLKDDPDTFQLKHGGDGVDDIKIIAIYENKNLHPQREYPQDFIQGSQAFADGIKNTFFPTGAHIVTPIAIFREIKV